MMNPRKTKKENILRQRLKEILAEAWNREFYKKHWGYKNLDDVLNLVDTNFFDQIPIVRKKHLKTHWNQIMQVDGAVDIVSSSGTTGRPVDIPVHRLEDRDRILRVQRLFRELNIQIGSRVLLLLSLGDLFTLGPLAWEAIKEQGACAIRSSAQRLERVIQIFKHLRPGFVIGNPFVLLRMAEEAGERWPDTQILPKRAFLAVAATFDDKLKATPIAQAVKDAWGLEFYLNEYGNSELGPVAYECTKHQGFHIHDDFYFVELIDIETGQPVRDSNKPGEVVVSGLTFPRGFLPIRYATGDVAAWIKKSPCLCGRLSPRLGPIIGRIDHHLKISGQTVFPDHLLSIVDSLSYIKRSAVSVRLNHISEDEVSLLIIPNNNYNQDIIKQKVSDRLSQSLAVIPRVIIITEEELNHIEYKASERTNKVKIPRFFDFRS